MSRLPFYGDYRTRDSKNSEYDYDYFFVSTVYCFEILRVLQVRIFIVDYRDKCNDRIKDLQSLRLEINLVRRRPSQQHLQSTKVLVDKGIKRLEDRIRK